MESAWIIYNRPKNNELTNEYAGFLMALGLNGHLPNLDTLNVHDYLSKVGTHSSFGPVCFNLSDWFWLVFKSVSAG